MSESPETTVALLRNKLSENCAIKVPLLLKSFMFEHFYSSPRGSSEVNKEIRKQGNVVINFLKLLIRASSFVCPEVQHCTALLPQVVVTVPMKSTMSIKSHCSNI